MDTGEGADGVAVFRCERCGDTFPTSTGASVTCPSCGSDDVHPASEPLL